MNNKPYPKKNSKGKKPFTKETKFIKSGDFVKGVGASENDWQWYAANEQLLKDAASIQFSNSLGLDVSLDDADNEIADLKKIPGICRLSMIPTVGHSEDPSSAVNVAAKNINSWVRHANSGSRNYESSDLMMTILATGSVLTYIAQLERLYGLARVYSQQNRYMAHAMLASQVGDTVADSIIENLADFRYYINNAIIKASTIKAPKGLTVIDRHLWLASHVWKDDTSSKAQVYIPFFTHFYKYVPNKFNTGGSLEYVAFPTGSGSTYTSLFGPLTQMIDVLIRDDDTNTIWGDIIKAYGDEGCYRLESLPTDYAVIPEYNEEVLMQIENANALGIHIDNGADAVAQYNNYLISVAEAYLPALTKNSLVSIVQGSGVLTKRILNVAHDNPTVADNMIATRFTIGVHPTQTINLGLTSAQVGTLATATAGDNTPVLSYGTELMTEFVIYVDPTNYTVSETLYSLDVADFDDVDIAKTTCQRLAREIILLSKFKYHPFIYLLGFINTGFKSDGYFGPADNYTELTYTNIFKLNNTALLNEFAVPQLGIIK